MMQQLALFEDSQIHCTSCGAVLRSLFDLRGTCATTGDIHHVNTSDYFVLYTKTYPVVLA